MFKYQRSISEHTSYSINKKRQSVVPKVPSFVSAMHPIHRMRGQLNAMVNPISNVRAELSKYDPKQIVKSSIKEALLSGGVEL